MEQTTLGLESKEETRAKLKQQLDKQIAALGAQAAAYRSSIEIVSAQIDDLKKQIVLTCPNCDRDEQIQNLTYIQTHWYTPPRGCTEGDYWNEGEGQYDCPHCKTRWRLYKLPEIEAMKRLFKEVVKEHKG